MAPTRPLIPPAALAMSVIANLMLAAGFAGLFVPQVIPALADPVVAWSLVGVGIAVEIAAMIGIVGAIRRHHRDRGHS